MELQVALQVVLQVALRALNRLEKTPQGRDGYTANGPVVIHSTVSSTAFQRPDTIVESGTICYASRSGTSPPIDSSRVGQPLAEYFDQDRTLTWHAGMFLRIRKQLPSFSLPYSADLERTQQRTT
jgi:hypothetical protein